MRNSVFGVCLVFCLFTLCVPFSGNAQLKMPANTKADLLEIQKDIFKNKGIPSLSCMDRFPINRLKGSYYISFIAQINKYFVPSALTSKGILVGNPVKGVVSLKVPIDLLLTIDYLQGISVLQLAGKIKPVLDKAVHDVGADSVQLGIGLPQGYTGENVFIGITDWGFDYTSPMFYDTSLQQSRIYAAWDQFKSSGPSPAGFFYGTEYSSIPEYLAAGCDTANIYSYATHGTHVAGICAGSGAGTNLRGIAYNANYLMATFLVDESAVLDAWEWMYTKSQVASKRLVVNMSWGLYHMGTLDGNSLLSQAIDGYSDLGVVFVNSAGNNGNVNFHLKKNFSNDTISSKIDFYTNSANPNVWGQSIHMWGEQQKSFSAGLKVLNNSGSLLAQTPLYSTNGLNSAYLDTFIIVGLDTVYYTISADSAHILNGRPQMRILVKSPSSSLKVVLYSTALDGIVHYWNVTELSTDVGNWGMPFSFYSNGSLSGDNLYGISEPSCTNSVISVAAYASKVVNSNGTASGGARASFSSIGPRIDEVRKPDIAAPGVAVASSISSFTDNAYTAVQSVDFNGRTYPFAKFSGTSMSSPVVAGIAALMLEANPYLSALQVKQILMQTAREDSNTGDISDTGSVQWGYGKVNALKAVQLALNTVGLDTITEDTPWAIYPNPALQEIHFTLLEELPKRVEIIDNEGKILSRQISANKVIVSDLKPGLYWVRMCVDGRIQQQSFVKQ